MGRSVPRIVVIIGALLRASLLTAMQYRADFLFDGLTGLLRTAATVAPLLLVYEHTDQVLGWGWADALLVMALFLLMQALVGGIVEPNLGEVVEAVRTGTLDLVLMKPVDAQLLVSFRRLAPSAIWDLVAGIGLGAWAVAHIGAPSGADVVVMVVMLVSGLAAVYGLWVLVICTSFFFVRVDNLRFLLGSVTGAGRWPITVFRGWVRWVLTIVIPVGVITSFPAMALRGTWDLPLVGIAVTTGLVFAVGSRWAWRRSLASYASASS